MPDYFFPTKSLFFTVGDFEANLPFLPHTGCPRSQMLWLFACEPCTRCLQWDLAGGKDPKRRSLPFSCRGAQWVVLCHSTSRGCWGPGPPSAAAFWQWRTKAQPYFRPCSGRAFVPRSFCPVLSQTHPRAGFFTLCPSLADSLLMLAAFPVSVSPQCTWLPPKLLHFP